MKLLLGLLFAFSSFAQATLNITGPSARVPAGSTATITLSAVGVTGQNVAGLQFSLPGLSWAATPTIGAAGTAAGKSIYCATVTSGLNCLVVGFNSTVIADGVLATVQLTVPRSVVSGNTSLALSGTLGASPLGAAVTVGAGSPFSLATSSACDPDGSGTSTATDFTLVLPQWLGTAVCSPLADLNSDGKCDILDATILAVAVGGGACNAK